MLKHINLAGAAPHFWFFFLSVIEKQKGKRKKNKKSPWLAGH